MCCRCSRIGSRHIAVAIRLARVTRENGYNRSALGRIFRGLHFDILLLGLWERRARSESKDRGAVTSVIVVGLRWRLRLLRLLLWLRMCISGSRGRLGRLGLFFAACRRCSTPISLVGIVVVAGGDPGAIQSFCCPSSNRPAFSIS